MSGRPAPLLLLLLLLLLVASIQLAGRLAGAATSSEPSDNAAPTSSTGRPNASPNSNPNPNLNSNTSSLEQAGEELEETSWDRAVRLNVIAFCSLVFVVGICANALIMTVIAKSKRDTTVTDIFIGNLAAADILLLFSLVFFNTTMYKRGWIFGSFVCRIYMSATSFSQFASSFLLVAMSVDRYIAICHPIFAQGFRQKTVAIKISGSIWLVCAILESPILIFARTNEDSTCAIFWPEYEGINSEKVYILYSFVLGYAIPVVIIFSMYGLIIHKLWRQASKANETGSARAAQNRETASRLVGHLVFYIIFGYAGCWGTYWATQLTLCFFESDQPPIPFFYTIVLASNCLSYANSALNPILYAFLGGNFRRRCNQVFRLKQQQQQQQQTATATQQQQQQTANSNNYSKQNSRSARI